MKFVKVVGWVLFSWGLLALLVYLVLIYLNHIF